jgi:hypothetical protein
LVVERDYFHRRDIRSALVNITVTQELLQQRDRKASPRREFG